MTEEVDDYSTYMGIQSIFVGTSKIRCRTTRNIQLQEKCQINNGKFKTKIKYHTSHLLSFYI